MDEEACADCSVQGEVFCFVSVDNMYGDDLAMQEAKESLTILLPDTWQTRTL